MELQLVTPNETMPLVEFDESRLLEVMRNITMLNGIIKPNRFQVVDRIKLEVEVVFTALHDCPPAGPLH